MEQEIQMILKHPDSMHPLVLLIVSILFLLIITLILRDLIHKMNLRKALYSIANELTFNELKSEMEIIELKIKSLNLYKKGSSNYNDYSRIKQIEREIDELTSVYSTYG